MVTLVLADDHHVVRQALCSLLEEQQDFRVVGEAGDGHQALRLVESLHPDVLVLDMALGDMNGTQVTQQAAECSPKTAVVVLSMHRAEGYVRESMRAGAKAYVLKESTTDELVHAIHEAAAGRRYLSRALSERAIDTYINLQDTISTTVSLSTMLTRREREVLGMVVGSKSARQIAAELFISPRTAEFHRANIMRKLGLHNQKELIRYCLQVELLPEEH